MGSLGAIPANMGWERGKPITPPPHQDKSPVGSKVNQSWVKCRLFLILSPRMSSYEQKVQCLQMCPTLSPTHNNAQIKPSSSPQRAVSQRAAGCCGCLLRTASRRSGTPCRGYGTETPRWGGQEPGWSRQRSRSRRKRPLLRYDNPSRR